MHRTNLRITALSLAIAFALAGSASAQSTDDTALFSTVVPPNVVLLVDNSGSMEHIVWHPMYDPTVTPACNYFDNNRNYKIDPDSTDITPGGGSDTTFAPGTYPIVGTNCVTQAREIFDDPAVSAVLVSSGNYEETQWSGHYLNWYYSAASAAYISEIVATANGTFSACIGGGTYGLYRRARVTAAKIVLKDVICQVNAAGAVRFGIAQFRRSGRGGYIRVPVNDYNDSAGNPVSYSLLGVTKTHGQHLDDAITALTGESSTPLAESLFQIYTYFMSRNALDRPPGANSGTFPEYLFTPSPTSGSGGPYSTAGAPTVPASPMQFDCQKNFVIVITDGQPTSDNFATWSGSEDQGFSNFTNLIGNYNSVDPEIENGALWLDDVAMFMHNEDFRPDMAPANGIDQTLDVYTVGFTTNGTANALLSKTAAVGGGQFYTSNDPDQLAQDIIAAVSDIVQKSQSFTAATVPAARTSSGGKFYTSVFVPSALNGFWEGHLRSWDITVNGHIHDSTGTCAVNDPEQPNECSLGSFKSTAVPFWDAGAVITARTPASRTLLTSKLNGSAISTKVQFNDSNVLAADLGVTAADIATYDFSPHPAPANATDLAIALVDNVRGCELGTFGAGCIKRPWLLGDMFHSDPIVVPGPPAGVTEVGHGAFRAIYKNRDKVIVAGANDGFMRFLDAGVWNPGAVPPAYGDGTGDEIVGFMPYAARQSAKEMARDTGTRDFYNVDGSPRVADVWFYNTATSNVHLPSGADWRTVLASGMRQGGEQLFALDITNPGAGPGTTCPNAKSPTDTGYPCYLWEFPRENATAAEKAIMGETWSEPIITKIRVKVDANDNGGAGFDRWVAIVGAGYHASGDPNDYTAYDALATKGRAVMVIDIQTGELIARKEFDPSATAASNTDPTSVAYSATNPERSMHYALAATPGVYDLDQDGYADTVYIPDLGGNVWKWSIGGMAHDSVNSASRDLDQNSTWEFSLFFQAPTYLDAGTGLRHWKSFFFGPSGTIKSGKLWLALGSGERTHLQFPGLGATTAENNRLYAIIDSDPLNSVSVAASLQESDLLDLTTGTGCPDLSATKGFYFVGADGEKFITETDIFFYIAFAASYTPTVSTSPCSANGLANLYAFRIYCGEGVFTDPGTGSAVTSVQIGDGMPTAPKITISTDPSGKHTVVVNNQNGDLIDPSRPKCTTPPCTTSCDKAANPSCPLPPDFPTTGQMYWREF
jgi:type IV pilus assembly protein PilY1